MPLEIVFDFMISSKAFRGYLLSIIIQDIRGCLVRLDILLNGEMVDALSTLIHRGHASDFGRKMCVKLKN